METIIETSENFIFHCRFEKGLSPKTIQTYTSDINQFTDLLSNKNYSKKLKKIDKVVLKEFLQLLSNKKPKTIKRKMAMLKALFNFLEFEDAIKINPFRKIQIQIKESKKLPSVLTISDVLKIFKTVYEVKIGISSHESYSFKEITRDIAVLELLFATGIRVSELCNLKVKNVGQNFSSIMVKGKGDKERIIQICNKETILALKEYIKKNKVIIEQTGYGCTTNFHN